MPSDADFGVPSLSARYAVQIRRLADYLAAQRASARTIAAELALLADRSAPAPLPRAPKVEPPPVEAGAAIDKERPDLNPSKLPQKALQTPETSSPETEGRPEPKPRIGTLLDTTA